MKIARISLRSSARPRVALERDAILYDVEALEQELGAAVPIPCDPWDFHTRVVALGCAGLTELDRKLLQGQRPTAARVGTTGVAWLAPSDVDRVTLLHADVRARSRPAVRVGHAPSMVGQDALVDMPDGESSPSIEVGVAATVSEELRDATRAEAKNAVVGWSIYVDWCARDRERVVDPAFASLRGLRPQLGPVLVPASVAGDAGALRASVQIDDGREFSLGRLADLGVNTYDLVAAVSHEVVIRPGDVVTLGPLHIAETSDIRLRMHQRVTISVEKLGALRGAPVPRRGR